MNTVPTKKDYAGEERSRRGLPSFDSTETPMDSRISPQRRSFASGGLPRERRSSGEQNYVQDTQMGGITEGLASEQPDAPITGAIPDNVEEGTDEDDAEEDVDAYFNERDEQIAEERFRSEMNSLQARIPASPRSNPRIISLLEELDALGSALEAKIKDGSADETIKVESSAALGLPSPTADEGDLGRVKLEEHSTLALRQRPQTPPVEGLPFLASGPLTPTSFMDGWDGDSGQHDEIKNILAKRLADQMTYLEDEYVTTRDEFIRDYKEWRIRVEDIEDAKRARMIEPSSSPPPPEQLLATSIPSVGRRGRLAGTDLDFQKVLKESEESHAREEQLRREREDRIYEAPETFNDQREAVIPDMLNQYEADESVFPDNNNFIPPGEALVAYEWLPKKDDFTKEEHETFVMEYVQSPKRFGTIGRSEKLSLRTVGELVQHYYATKRSCPYKTHEVTFSKSARGKKMIRRRNATSALGFGNDGNLDEGAILPFTDAGRPRRAAAPTFGAVESSADSDQPAAATTPARRGQAGIMNGEKTSAKRAKTGAKPGRKPKAQLLAPQPGPSPAPSPQKNDVPVFRIEQQPLPVEPPPMQHPADSELEGAQTLAALTGHSFPLPPNPASRTEDVWAPPPVVPVPVVHRPTAAPEAFNQDQMETVIPTHTGSEAPAMINSYWNVGETSDLRNYLNYYGMDWQAIAENIPAKTHTMVSLLMVEVW